MRTRTRSRRYTVRVVPDVHGPAGMTIIARRKEDQNRAAIDPWSAVHLATGLAFGLMNVPLRGALAAALAYEIAEQFLERSPLGQDLFETSGPETLANAIVDMAALFAGHRLGQLWNGRTR